MAEALTPPSPTPEKEGEVCSEKLSGGALLPMPPELLFPGHDPRCLVGLPSYPRLPQDSYLRRVLPVLFKEGVLKWNG